MPSFKLTLSDEQSRSLNAHRYLYAWFPSSSLPVGKQVEVSVNGGAPKEYDITIEKKGTGAKPSQDHYRIGEHKKIDAP